MGWAGVKNGELLKLVEAEFGVFITSDKNLRYQQNLKDRKIAILLLPGNQIPIVENLLPQIYANPMLLKKQSTNVMFRRRYIF